MNLVPSHTQSRRTRRTTSLLAGALLTGAGAAHAQSTTYGTIIVPSSYSTVATYTGNTTSGTPTFNESFVGGGTAVPYATQSFTAPAAATYKVSTTVTSGYSGGNNFVEFLYAPTFTASSPSTNFKNFYQPTNSALSFSDTLAANGKIALVDGGISNTDTGVVQTTISQYLPGSTSAIPDNSTTGISQTLNVSDSTTITSFDSITIDSLTHPFIGDLVATLTHNGTTVDLFDHTGADNNPSDPNYNYGQGSAASFDGNNYTFSLSGASLAAVPNYTAAPDGTTFMATGNAANGFDKADAANTLNNFVGQSVNGAWVLNLKDEQVDDTGSFTGFSFSIDGAGAAAAPEPSQWASLGFVTLGLGGLILRARRRVSAPSVDA